MNTGIHDMDTSSKSETITGIYAIDGKRISSTMKGINIIKHADGTMMKIASRKIAPTVHKIEKSVRN